MGEKNYNFQQKIECIYTYIANEDIDKLTKLFLVKGKTDFEYRKIHIRNNWLTKQKSSFYPRLFKNEYRLYDFSKLNINSIPLFTNANEFLTISLEEFCERIKNYVIAKKGSEDSSFYRYLYMYHSNSPMSDYKIHYYKIEYVSKKNNNEFYIDVYPPTYKQEQLQVEKYRGIAIISNKIILQFQNSNDYISAIFNPELLNSFQNYLVGVAIGIADINQKTPVAKKAILSKEEITDLKELYLTINETETILAEENLYPINRHVAYLDSHLKKYAHKIDTIDDFFENVSNDYYREFYYQLIFTEFKEITKKINNVAKDETYSVEIRQRVLKTLLFSHEHEQYKALYIVMPVLNKHNIFNHLSPTALFIKERIKELSKKIHIEIIFTVKLCSSLEFNKEMKEFLEEIKDDISLYFIYEKNIENEVNSLDFMFTDKRNFLITKHIRSMIPAFRFFKDKETLEEYESTYKKIKNRTLPYKEFIKDKYSICHLAHDLKNILLGKWYLYYYNKKVVEMEINFQSNLNVEVKENGRLIYIGELVNNTLQVMATLESLIDSKMITLVFKNRIKQNFLITNILVEDNSFNNCVVGFLIRKKQERAVVSELLQEFSPNKLNTKKLKYYLTAIEEGEEDL